MKLARQDLDNFLTLFPREFLDLTDTEQQVSQHLYRLLAEGQPVSLTQLAETANVSSPVVEAILHQWPGVYKNDAGHIIGYWGLALPEMDHRFAVGGRELYTWCSWDSLFIPAILQTSAQVHSTCPVTGHAIRLTVTPQGVEVLEPVEVVMSFVLPDASQVRQDVIQHFCHYVYFFRSEEVGTQWIGEHPGTLLLSIQEAFELGRRKNAMQYKELLGSRSEDDARCGTHGGR